MVRIQIGTNLKHYVHVSQFTDATFPFPSNKQQPNIRRTFPGPSRGKQFGKALRAQQEEESDDDESSDDSVQVVQPPRGGGKQLGTGKYLRP